MLLAGFPRAYDRYRAASSNKLFDVNGRRTRCHITIFTECQQAIKYSYGQQNSFSANSYLSIANETHLKYLVYVIFAHVIMAQTFYLTESLLHLLKNNQQFQGLP